MAIGASTPGTGATTESGGASGESASETTTATETGGSPASSAQSGTSQQQSQDDQNTAAYWRRQAEKKDKELKQVQRASMSDADRYKAERDEAMSRAEQAETKSKQFLVNSKLEQALIKAGCHDPDGAARCANMGVITVTDDGQVLGVDTAVAELKRTKQYFFGPAQRPAVGSPGGVPSGGSAAASGANGQTSSQQMNAFLRQTLNRR